MCLIATMKSSAKVKPKKCAWKPCGKDFKQFKTTDKFCSRACYLLDFTQKEIDKKVKDMKVGLRKLSEYEDMAKKVFQKWIRIRDANLNCISCGTSISPVWDGGHYAKAELYSGLIFHPKNCHKQCRKCNFYLGGNEANYRLGLINRYGSGYVEEIEALKIELKDKKYTREELIQITNTYKQKIKDNEFN